MERNSEDIVSGSDEKFIPSIGWEGGMSYKFTNTSDIITSVTIKGICNGYVQVLEWGLRNIYPLDDVNFIKE
jgi:hypothetical protein